MKRALQFLVLVTIAATAVEIIEKSIAPEEPAVYWPIQGYEINDHLNEDIYREYLNGCVHAYSEDLCIRTERQRISQNHRLPALQRNFTETGFTSLPVPRRAYEELIHFWPSKRLLNHTETWDLGSNLNHWACTTQKVDFGLVKDGWKTIEELHHLAEMWSQQKLKLTLVDGIRIYNKGCVEAPHLEEPPLVISTLLNVAQHQDDPSWRIEVIGHNGKPSYVHLRPSEVLLYESHSVIIGHPHPLKGDSVAMLNVHFEVEGYSEWYESQQTHSHHLSAEKLFLAALNNPAERPAKSGLPYYIQPGSVEAKRWNQEFVFSRDPNVDVPAKKGKTGRTTGVTSAHILAATGDLERLKIIAEKDPASLNEADSNGWKPIHEAARAGQTEVLAYLIQHNVNVNERTNNGSGASPLWWAEHELDEDHEAIKLLKRHGGVVIEPNAPEVEPA